MSPRVPSAVRALGLLPALVLLPACGGADSAPAADSGDATAVAVSATDDSCQVDTTELTAGRHEFTVTNTGSSVTEFYVYAAGDQVVGEVENIAPGVSRSVAVDLVAGDYEATCKPGMAGDGVRTGLTVTGA